MYIFLLAGIEVVLSAVVLASCNFLFIRKKTPTPPDKLENVTVGDGATTEACSELVEVGNMEEKGASEEQEKEAIKKEEHEEEFMPESVTMDSQEVENFMKKPQQNGDVASSPETRL